MGWTGMSPRYDGDKKKWLEDQFTGKNSHLSDLSIKGSTAYGIYWWNDGNSTKHEAIPSGALVKFARELDFRSFKADTFTLAKDGRKTFFYAPNGTKCRIPKWQTRDHQIINH
jgi:hypothetical protein